MRRGIIHRDADPAVALGRLRGTRGEPEAAGLVGGQFRDAEADELVQGVGDRAGGPGSAPGRPAPAQFPCRPGPPADPGREGLASRLGGLHDRHGVPGRPGNNGRDTPTRTSPLLPSASEPAGRSTGTVAPLQSVTSTRMTPPSLRTVTVTIWPGKAGTAVPHAVGDHLPAEQEHRCLTLRVPDTRTGGPTRRRTAPFPGPAGRRITRSAARYQPLRSWRAITTRWIWLVPS